MVDRGQHRGLVGLTMRSRGGKLRRLGRTEIEMLFFAWSSTDLRRSPVSTVSTCVLLSVLTTTRGNGLLENQNFVLRRFGKASRPESYRGLAERVCRQRATT